MVSRLSSMWIHVFLLASEAFDSGCVNVDERHPNHPHRGTKGAVQATIYASDVRLPSFLHPGRKRRQLGTVAVASDSRCLIRQPSFSHPSGRHIENVHVAQCTHMLLYDHPPPKGLKESAMVDGIV